MDNLKELAETAKAINNRTAVVTEKDVAQYRRNLLNGVLNAVNAVMLDNGTSARLASKFARFRQMIVSEIAAENAKYDNAAPTVFDNTEGANN